MDLKDYAEKFEKASKDFTRFQKRFLLDQAEGIRDEAKKRTPVDTGALRESWYVGNEKYELSADDKGKVVRNDIRPADLRTVGRNITVTIGNPQHYASYIEFGTVRGIKPFNMLTVPLQSWHRNAQARFDKAIDDFFRQEGIK